MAGHKRKVGTGSSEKPDDGTAGTTLLTPFQNGLETIKGLTDSLGKQKPTTLVFTCGIIALCVAALLDACLLGAGKASVTQCGWLNVILLLFFSFFAVLGVAYNLVDLWIRSIKAQAQRDQYD